MNAIYYSAIFFPEGEATEALLNLGSKNKILDPRRVLKPPTLKNLRKSGAARSIGEWKRICWGTERIDSEQCQIVPGGVIVSFQSEGCPDGILGALVPPGAEAVTISRDGFDLRGWNLGGHWQGAAKALEREDDLRQIGLWETVDGRMRVETIVSKREFDLIRQGKAVAASLPWGREYLQRDLLGYTSGQIVFDDSEPLDDVIYARRGDTFLWIDLLCR